MTTEEQKKTAQDELDQAQQTAEDAQATPENLIEGDVVDAAAETDTNEVAALEEQLAQAKDQVLRAHADAQNARRRAEQDVEKAHKFALEKFTKELLPVIDSLERAIEAFDQNDAPAALREGVEMTLSMFISTLGKFNVEPVNPQGEPFDPQFHEAMSMVPNPEVEPNTVIAVMQKGYLLNGRLVRPAMVMVSKSA
ncbi:nucleotide exchange factor GrpE [Oceanospirillum linum]|uniref:Protein GrpE n=1 Tax=Oceanospirillum linum TaxID=966 RepID=A0A1T1H8L4_OCELI|nr:nucleotide exchange factor GrpE [Oceanospirillum linum]OOV86214.1 nucleotide exchange factor GrpE [Oceanospirillum linum]SEG38085.1 molecular chaperone GrpE [Oleiphilus messinensis]SMP32206.1 molecular chaperone GrpE [Oceanospirillum linum]